MKKDMQVKRLGLILYRDSVYTGMLDYNRFSAGQEFGTHWIPTETDVSIRPGWYYHSDHYT